MEKIRRMEVWDVQILYPGYCYMDGDRIVFLENDSPTIFRKVKNWTVGREVEPKHRIRLIGNLKPVIEIDVYKDKRDEKCKIEFV